MRHLVAMILVVVTLTACETGMVPDPELMPRWPDEEADMNAKVGIAMTCAILGTGCLEAPARMTALDLGVETMDAGAQEPGTQEPGNEVPGENTADTGVDGNTDTAGETPDETTPDMGTPNTPCLTDTGKVDSNYNEPVYRDSRGFTCMSRRLLNGNPDCVPYANLGTAPKPDKNGRATIKLPASVMSISGDLLETFAEGGNAFWMILEDAGKPIPACPSKENDCGFYWVETVTDDIWLNAYDPASVCK